MHMLHSQWGNLTVPKYGTSLEPAYIIDLTSPQLRLDRDHHLTVFNVWVYNLLQNSQFSWKNSL